jgi:ribosome biogenesis GTPase
MQLNEFGWTPLWQSAFESHLRDGLEPGRVFSSHRGLFVVRTASGDRHAEPTGRLRFDSSIWPVTGDWVALRDARIEAVLPRRTAFVRKQPGNVTQAQVLAANIDVCFLVTGLDGDFNIRRLERYLHLAAASGARPVILLNKTDLCDDLVPPIQAAERVAAGAPVLPLSAASGQGLHVLSTHVEPGETAVLLGSSGVGKSTIVNALLGREELDTQPVREHDSRGRHTTSHRELFMLDSGWLLMDVPGIRELQLWSDPDALDETFDEIAELSASCRFRDCTHAGEPGCAVMDNVAADRLESFHKLRRELNRLDRMQDARAESEHNKKMRSVHRSIREIYRLKGR